MKQKEKRELLFRIMFGQSFHENEIVDMEAIESFTKNDKEITQEDKEQIIKELTEIKKVLPEIDAHINRCVERWNTETMAKVELSILRLMVYELFYKKETPVGVLANDAVKLASGYGQDASHRFINGAIAKLIQDLENPKE